MVSVQAVRGFLATAFREQALAIGGLAAEERLSDEQVWDLMRSLDLVRERAMRQVGDRVATTGMMGGVESQHEPHPAIEEFLTRLRDA
jgi:hypothetical protein